MQKYFTKQTCIKILLLFVLIKTNEISVSIRKYPQISIYFPDICFSEYLYFSEVNQIKKLNIRDIRSKSQIPSKIRISDLCPCLKNIIYNIRIRKNLTLSSYLNTFTNLIY